MGIIIAGAVDIPLSIGGRNFTRAELNSMIILYGNIASQGGFTTGRKANGTAGYAVTAAKTLTVHAVKFFGNTTSTYIGIQALYGDTDVGSNGSAPTNPVYLAANSTVLQMNFAGANLGIASYGESHMDFQVPATKYLAFRCNNPGTFIAYCLET